MEGKRPREPQPIFHKEAAMSFRFKRSEIRLPVVQLNHMEISLSFFETHVDSTATLNGKAWESFQFSHGAFAKGGVLELTLGKEPNPAWGRK